MLSSLILALASLAPAEGLRPPAPPSEYSSTDDCAIFALMARERLAFGHSRSLDDGRIGDYQIRCDWPAFGMENPAFADHAPTSQVSFTRPTYGWKRKGAMVGYTVRFYGHHQDVHRVTDSQSFACALKRRPEGWKIVECRPGLPE